MADFLMTLSQSEYILVLAILAVLLFFLSFVLAYFIISIINWFVDNSILKNSPAIDALLKLNSSVVSKYFIDIKTHFEYVKRHPNYRSYMNASPEKILQDFLSKDPEQFVQICEVLHQNTHNLRVYQSHCDLIFKNHAGDCAKNHYCATRERRLFEEHIHHPPVDVQVHIHSRYTSPKGRNRYHSETVFRLEDVESSLKQLQEKTRYELNRERERALMSPSLRYDIMKRDGFRCVLCGASQKDGAKLHVDHIYPIAKGGKTEANNLRTLCDQCNLGKRDKYDPHGLN